MKMKILNFFLYKIPQGCTLIEAIQVRKNIVKMLKKRQTLFRRYKTFWMPGRHPFDVFWMFVLLNYNIITVQS